MAKSVKDLVRPSAGHENGHPAAPSFVTIDFEGMSRRLHVDERAAAAARERQPASDAPGPDSVELGIRAEIEGRERNASGAYLAERDRLEARIRNAVITSNRRVEIEAA